MNRLIRIILYITAACVGVGSAALILSLALGGGDLDFEDNVFYQAKNAAQDFASKVRQNIRRGDGRELEVTTTEEIDAAYDSETGELQEQLAAIDGGIYLYEYDEDDHEYEGDELFISVPASQVNTLSIDLHHACLYISESEDGRVYVSMSGQTQGMDADCSGGELAIRDNRQGRQERHDVEVYLEMPEDMHFHTADIQTDAGMIESECSFFADLLMLSADAGTISIFDELECANFTASVGAGSIDIEDGHFGTVQLDCGLGTIDMEGSIGQDSQISCGMGSVNLELDGDTDRVNYVLSCGMGSIDIGDHSYTAISSERSIDNGANVTFTLKCGMGEICIE